MRNIRLFCIIFLSGQPPGSFQPLCRRSRIGFLSSNCANVTNECHPFSRYRAKLLLLLRHCGWIYSFYDGNWGNAKNFLPSNCANVTNECHPFSRYRAKLLLLLRHCGWIYSFYDGDWGQRKEFFILELRELREGMPPVQQIPC
jgi:hypothetical protein